MSTHHTHPQLGRYARSCVWAPLFRNSGSATVLPLLLKAPVHFYDVTAVKLNLVC